MPGPVKASYLAYVRARSVPSSPMSPATLPNGQPVPRTETAVESLGDRLKKREKAERDSKWTLAKGKRTLDVDILLSRSVTRLQVLHDRRSGRKGSKKGGNSEESHDER